MSLTLPRPRLPPDVLAYMLSNADADTAFRLLGELAGSPDRPDLSSTELVLAKRSDQDALSVALFGHSVMAVRAAFARGRPNCLASACFANSYTQSNDGWGGTPLAVGDVKQALSTDDKGALAAYATNPSASAAGIADVFKGRPPVADVAPDTLASFALALSTAPSLRDVFSPPYSTDGGNAAAYAVEYLSHRLPHTKDGATALCKLLLTIHDMCPPQQLVDFDWRPLLTAWQGQGASPPGDAFFLARMSLVVHCSFGYDYSALVVEADPAVRAAGMAIAPIKSNADLAWLRRSDEAAYYAGMPWNTSLYGQYGHGPAFLATCRDHSHVAMLFLSRSRFLARMHGDNDPVTRGELRGMVDEAVASHRDNDPPDTLSAAVDALEAPRGEAAPLGIARDEPVATQRRVPRRAYPWLLAGLLALLILVFVWTVFRHSGL